MHFSFLCCVVGLLLSRDSVCSSGLRIMLPREDSPWHPQQREKSSAQLHIYLRSEGLLSGHSVMYFPDFHLLY